MSVGVKSFCLCDIIICNTAVKGNKLWYVLDDLYMSQAAHADSSSLFLHIKIVI